MNGSVGSRLAALVVALGVALGLLWLGAWLLDVVLGPFTPLLTAIVVAALVLLVLGRDDG
ncbi:hypothetical protein DP107_10690 [Haloglomus irregulare]|jgi:hypothetical protein|uniref:Major facilitator superfamily (MFS) profile domain-containing protein n=1 Tax=Haloglomus irregulare TaxID=2234134 RepID=A0A554N8B4_9EURY|nr:hypothetical protein [Haloglomus irregulare]TSD13635.1 hypothetical protein DP107_10690 [Haloglomus irregulare]